MKKLFQKKYLVPFAFWLATCVGAVVGYEATDFVIRSLIEGKVENALNEIAARSGTDIRVKVTECRHFTRTNKYVCDVAMTDMISGSVKEIQIPVPDDAL